MDDVILKSIIEITQQRDVDSLEYSLAATLAEMLPIQTLSIYKLLHEGKIETVEEIIHLSAIKDSRGETSYVWRDEMSFVRVDADLEKVLRTGDPLMSRQGQDLMRLLIPMSCDGKVFGVLSLESAQDLSPFKTVIEGVVKIFENYSAILYESERDKLTGLLNRRTFENKLTRLLKMQRARKEEDFLKFDSKKLKGFRRYIGPDSFAWLVVLDIDHFKRVNDTYGHVYGDEVLLTVSQKMRSSFRRSDLLFRFGGEEFVIVLEPIPFEMAGKTVERFRNTIANHPFSRIDQVTISMGFAKITESDYPPTILENADKALYYAKEHGRNCAYSYEILLEEGRLTEHKEEGSVDLF